MPRDIPGQVEVAIHRREDDWDSSDEEPIVNSKRQKRCEGEPKWRKCEASYECIASQENNVEVRKQQLIEVLKGQTPRHVFENIFDAEMWDMIIQYTIVYARQNNNHNFNITVDEIKIFFGILIASGYHCLPKERLYWSNDEDCKVPFIQNAMSRNRFLEIKKYLHFCDNSEFTTSKDKMFKLRPLIDLLIKKFLQWGVFHKDLSIDESMVKYFGRHPSKQFIRGKPCRFGYKNWMISSSDGYCYAFDVYCGKSGSDTIKEPLGSKVVKLLLEKINCNPRDHVVYFDNFFTSYNLLSELRKAGYRATGTVRENRTKKCLLSSVKEMKKKQRGDHDYSFDPVNQVLFVRWLDNSVCTMGTNHDSVEPFGKVKRWNANVKKKVDVKIPHVFQSYNQGMGGVDQADQSISLYRIAVRGKKWWWILFTYFVDLSIANAWRLHSIANNNSHNQLQFRRSIARSYVRQTIPISISHPTASVVDGMQYDGIGHYPKKLDKQLRCTVCHNKARWQCKKCLKTMCVEKTCFEIFHTI